MNLSKKSFSTCEYKLLGYGLNFIPTKHFFNKTDIIKDINAFSRKVKLRAHFDTTSEPGRTEFERKFHRTNGTWEPKTNHHTVSTFLESFKQDAIEASDKAKPNKSNNLTKNEDRALQFDETNRHRHF